MFEAHSDMTIRRLGDVDHEALVRLAQRDSAEVPAGSVLAAVAPGGALLAAVSLETRELIADPFLPTKHAVAMLRSRAASLTGESVSRPRGGHRRFQRRRRRPAEPGATLAGSPPGAGGRLLYLRQQH